MCCLPEEESVVESCLGKDSSKQENTEVSPMDEHLGTNQKEQD